MKQNRLRRLALYWKPHSRVISMVITFKDIHAIRLHSCQIPCFAISCASVGRKKSDGITLVMWNQMCSVCPLCVTGRGWSQSNCGISVRISQHLQQPRRTRTRTASDMANLTVELFLRMLRVCVFL